MLFEPMAASDPLVYGKTYAVRQHVLPDPAKHQHPVAYTLPARIAKHVLPSFSGHANYVQVTPSQLRSATGPCKLRTSHALGLAPRAALTA